MTDALFGREFLERLEVVRATARRVIREGSWKILRERRPGQGQEFSDHRDYAPGDEIRHIDWSAYARLDRLKVRIFEEREPPHLTILLDRSRSMEGAPFREARRLAATLTHVGLGHLGPVTIRPFSDEPQSPLGPLRGLGAFPEILRYLSALETGGVTRIGPALRAIPRRRRSLTVVISDLLEEEGWEQALRRSRGHRVFLAHCAAPEPTLAGTFIIRDGETGERIRRTVTSEVLRRRGDLLETESRRIDGACRRRGASYHRVEWGTPFDVTAIHLLREMTCTTL
jgi:uncharacterized protein (DUF58 family)